jgi:hypothetical protein
VARGRRARPGPAADRRLIGPRSVDSSSSTLLVSIIHEKAPTFPPPAAREMRRPESEPTDKSQNAVVETLASEERTGTEKRDGGTARQN